MNETLGDTPDWVPVFPLPEAVLFPRHVLPLHVFEPRYRALVVDALAGDHMIAVALLKPGYECDYFTDHAPIHTLVGVGRIIACECLDGGKHNILLRGECRAKLVEESARRPYRYARVQRVQQRCGVGPEVRTRLRCELFDVVRRTLLHHPGACEQFLPVFQAPLSLGELADLIAGSLPVAGELRQRLLAEIEVCRRVKLLIEHIPAVGLRHPAVRRCDKYHQCHLN